MTRVIQEKLTCSAVCAVLFWAPRDHGDHDDTAPHTQSQNSHPCVCKQALLSVKGLQKSEIRPFVATGMDLEVIIRDEVVRQSQILYVIYMITLKNNANKLKHL